MHELVYISEGIVLSQPCRVLPNGDISLAVWDCAEIENQRGDSYVYCTTCGQVIGSGETHDGATLAEDYMVNA